jgi:hypothetical protein
MHPSRGEGTGLRFVRIARSAGSLAVPRGHPPPAGRRNHGSAAGETG